MAVLGAFAIPVVGQLSASAASTDLYVNNNQGANCSDAGTGLQSAPFCTVSAAAKVVLPGQTVHIVPGTYKETVTLTRSGTADAPITFDGASADRGAAIIGPDWQSPAGRAFVVSGAQHVVLKGAVFAGNKSDALVVDNSSDVRLDHISGWIAPGNTGVRISNGSSKVTLAKSWPSSVVVDQGVSGSVITTNDVDRFGITVLGSPDTIVVANTIHTDCGHDGIDLAGASTGAVIENNVIDTSARHADPTVPTGPCAAGSSDTGLLVSAEAAKTAKVDYNVISPTSGGTAYDWAGTTYRDQPSFAAASGQGAHDFVADPSFPWNTGRPLTSPIVDSADELAPGMLDTDINGRPAKDDPLVPNTGTGSGYRDRGAYEFESFGSVYTPAGPTRVLDTRDGTGAAKGAVAPGGTVDLQVAGVGGVPATGVTAVTLNVTVTETTDSGFLTVFPHGGQRPTASNLNWTAGTTIANLVTVPVVDGKVSFFSGGGKGNVQVVADLAGYYGSKGSIFTTDGPTRLLDTRDGTGAAKGAVAPGGTVDLQVAGVGGVPASGVTAVTLNVTVTETTDSGFLTVFPHGGQRPTASNLNWTAGTTIANLVTVPVVDGKVSFFSGGGKGNVQVIADLAGYYSASGSNTYFAEGPWRLMDTRQDWYIDDSGDKRPAAVVKPGETLDLDVSQVRSTAVTLNVTVTDPTSDGFLTVFPHGTARPLASNLNWTAGQTIPNAVVVPVKDGKVSFYNGSAGSIDLVIDVFGRQSEQG